MNVLQITYFLNGALMVAMPIVLARYLVRKFDLDGRLFWIGAGTFVLSQVGHIPFVIYMPDLYNKLVMVHLDWNGQRIFEAIFLGLSAGLFEEIFRYGMYRWWAKDARSWSKGMLLGAGHGGVEAILVGLLVLMSYVNFSIMRTADLSNFATGENLVQLTRDVQAYWSAPWYSTLMGAVERLFAIPVHLAMSVVVLQALIRKRFWWVWAAVAFHALLDGVVVYAAQNGISVLAIEGIAGLFALMSVAIFFLLRKAEPASAPAPAAEKVKVAPIKPLDETPENLNATRYK